MQRIPLVDAQPDMALARDLVNDQQMLLLKKGVRLNAKNIRMLKSWGVPFIEIESESTEDTAREASDEDMDLTVVENRMAQKFGAWSNDTVMLEIRRVATDIIIGRRHRQDAADAD